MTTDEAAHCAELAVGWARGHFGTDSVAIVDRVVLDGGVTGARVERIDLAVGGEVGRSVAVVVKHTSRTETEVLALLAELAEPAVPQLLASEGSGEDRWMVIPWSDGRPTALMDEVPAAVGPVLARIHARYLDRPSRWPEAIERIDEGFVERALTEFLPTTLERLTPAGGVRQFRRRAIDQAGRLLADRAFLAALDTFPVTLVHGDLYGHNVLCDRSGAVLVIDWGAARVGPAMFDLAMSAWDGASELVSAYRTERDRIGAPLRSWRRELHWCRALINTTFAGVVARRSSLRDGSRMLDAAELARQRIGAGDGPGADR